MQKWTLILILIVLMGCKKPYNPTVIKNSVNFLVIEGVINTGADSTIIRLSRTVNVTSTTKHNPELGAQVTVENDQGKSFSLKEIGNGKYALPPLNLGVTPKYRLRVKTVDNKEYLSDFVAAKNSPPIDSISHEYAPTAENIYAYTHDPSNNTKYYRWEYQETYIFRSAIQSGYRLLNGDVVATTDATEISLCYVSDTSSTIVLATTAKLQQDIINRNPITQVSFTLDKLKIRYTILVKQYALTADAYNYYENLKKNTETIGGIFDAQPVINTGNIHCITNPAETVIGFISAGAPAQQRVFIDRSDIPPTRIGVDYSYCGIARIDWTGQYFPLPEIIKFGVFTPVSKVTRGYDPKTRDSVYNVNYADPVCTDCTLRGSNKKPAFWK